MLSFCEPLRKCREIGLEVILEEKVWRCFSSVVTYCSDFLETRDIFSIRHEAGKDLLCVRCAISFKNMLYNRERRNGQLVATADAQRQVQSLKKIVQMVGDLGQRQRRGQELAKIVRLLSRQSLADWTPFLDQLTTGLVL